MTINDYILLHMTMYDYVWVCMTMLDYEWLFMTMFDYVWLCMIMCTYVWLCMRKKKKAILKTFSYFFHLFETIKFFQTIYIFFHDSNVFNVFILFNKPWLCLPLFNLCLPLFTFVHLCLPLINWRIYAQILCLL